VAYDPLPRRKTGANLVALAEYLWLGIRNNYIDFISNLKHSRLDFKPGENIDEF
jgi:hypothetical protein